jgi:hypothetical protein
VGAHRVDLDRDIVEAKPPPRAGVEALVYAFLDREGNPGQVAALRELTRAQDHALDRGLERRLEQLDVEAHAAHVRSASRDGARQSATVGDAAHDAGRPQRLAHRTSPDRRAVALDRAQGGMRAGATGEELAAPEPARTCDRLEFTAVGGWRLGAECHDGRRRRVGKEPGDDARYLSVESRVCDPSAEVPR